MPVDPSDIEDHAERVSEDYDDEEAMRSAVSRKYYSLFHLVRSNLKGHRKSDFNFGQGDHGEAKRILRELVDNDLSEDFDDLHKDRKRADYELDRTIDKLFYKRFENKFKSTKRRIENQVLNN